MYKHMILCIPFRHEFLITVYAIILFSIFLLFVILIFWIYSIFRNFVFILFGLRFLSLFLVKFFWFWYINIRLWNALLFSGFRLLLKVLNISFLLRIILFSLLIWHDNWILNYYLIRLEQLNYNLFLIIFFIFL